jgi:hypothetical protein
MINLRSAIRLLVAALLRMAKQWARPGGGPKFVWG